MGLAAASCDRQDFIFDEVKPDSPWAGIVEEESRRGVDYICAQFVPCVGLGKYVLRQAFRAKAAIGVLDGFENQIGHIA